MDVKEVIEKRRAYRSLEPVEITKELIKNLGEAVIIAPSCFNNQPWRFVFVYETDALKKMHATLSKGNEWAYSASMIIAVFSKKDSDCLVKGREYYLFDTGMATAFLILRATELGLVAHPIAGYNEDGVKKALGITDDMTVITLVMVGKHSDSISPVLSDKQIEAEKKRPERFSMEKVVYLNRFK